MALPTFFGAGTGVEDDAGGTTLTPTYPASTAANDIAIFVAASSVANTITCGTGGWTALVESSNSNMSIGLYWKRLAGGDGDPTATFSAASSGTDSHRARIYVFRGVRTTGNPYNTFENGSIANTATPTTTAIVTSEADCLVVSILNMDDNQAWDVTAPPPSGWSDAGTEFTTATGPDGRIHAITFPQASANTVSAALFGQTTTTEICRLCTMDLVGAASGQTPPYVNISVG